MFSNIDSCYIKYEILLPYELTDPVSTKCWQIQKLRVCIIIKISETLGGVMIES